MKVEMIITGVILHAGGVTHTIIHACMLLHTGRIGPIKKYGTLKAASHSHA